MASGQGGFNPPPWQQGSNNGPGRNGPPPAKRSKSGPGPVITYYPPPPGYTGPARPPAWQQAQAWQPPPQHHTYGQPAYPGFPNQGYPAQAYGSNQYHQPVHRGSYPGAGQPTPPSSYPQHNTFQIPSTGYNPPAAGATTGQYSYGALPPPPPAPTYGQYGRAMPPPPPPPISALSSSPPARPPPPWMQPNAPNYNPPPGHNAGRRSSATVLDGNGDPLSPDTGAVYSDPSDVETDYVGAECYYAKHPDEIDENLSLGTIVNRHALPNRRPLPATFNEVEIEAIAPRNPQPSDLESISDYWINSRAHESMLDVRQTETWQHVRNDPIFREFPAVAEDHISPEEMVAMYRDRPDPTWTACEPSSSPEPEPQPRRRRRRSASVSEEGDMLGSLEEALGRRANGSESGDRPATGADQAQEEALARLGIVTGAPRPVPTRPNGTGANGISLPDGRKRSRDDGGGAGAEGEAEAEKEPGRPSKQPRYDSD